MFTARTDACHACASYAGRAIGVDVLKDKACEGSHIVVSIAAEPAGAGQQTVEYMTDHASVDEALAAGFEIARELIDQARRSQRGRAPS